MYNTILLFICQVNI